MILYYWVYKGGHNNHNIIAIKITFSSYNIRMHTTIPTILSFYPRYFSFQVFLPLPQFLGGKRAREFLHHHNFHHKHHHHDNGCAGGSFEKSSRAWASSIDKCAKVFQLVLNLLIGTTLGKARRSCLRHWRLLWERFPKKEQRFHNCWRWIFWICSSFCFLQWLNLPSPKLSNKPSRKEENSFICMPRGKMFPFSGHQSNQGFIRQVIRAQLLPLRAGRPLDRSPPLTTVLFKTSLQSTYHIIPHAKYLFKLALLLLGSFLCIKSQTFIEIESNCCSFSRASFIMVDFWEGCESL